MKLNKEIFEVLKEHKIDKDQGTLVLLGIYHGLDVDKICSEEVIKAINLTKIVEKDYKFKDLVWNLPLYEGQETELAWLIDYMKLFSDKNPLRRGSTKDVRTRMKEFLIDNSNYGIKDILEATRLYMRMLNDPKYCMHSHKFIYDGIGKLKKSTLLQYCEMLGRKDNLSDQKMTGKILS